MRISNEDVAKAFERFGTAAKMAGLMPPDGYAWSMANGDSVSPYSLYWRNTESGALESGGFLPQYLGSNAREAWATLHSYANVLYAIVNQQARKV